MTRATLKYENENFEKLMRRFKKGVVKDNVIKDHAKHEFYEKKSIKRKRALAAARKRAERLIAENKLPTKK